MAQNKKHHYVPKFLLKRFSRNEKSIALYNIASQLVVPSAPIKSQCYSDYLYGKDTPIEKALAGAEGEIATILRVMDKVLVPPKPFTPVHDALLFFVLSQHGRTLYAADALDEMFDGMMKNIYSELFKEMGADPSKFMISLREPATFALSNQVACYPLLWDLDYKVLVNTTQEEFVISDNPVVFYNQLLSFRNFNSNCGFATKGLQIFVPLDPKKTLMLYDRDMYRVGNDTKGVINIVNPQDVYELNTLQFVSARENIYFFDPAFNVKPLQKKATPYLRNRKVHVRAFEQNEPEGKAKYVGTTAEDVRTDLKLSFTSLRRSAKEWRDKERKKRYHPMVIVRNKKLVDTFEEFTTECKKGNYSGTQFKDFIKAKIEAEKKSQVS